MQNPLDDYLKNQNKNKPPSSAENVAKELSDEEIAAIAAKKKLAVRRILVLDFLLVPVIILMVYFLGTKDGADVEHDLAYRPPVVKQSYAQLNSYYSDAKDKAIFLPSIDQAYKLTRVERVKYDSTQSKMSYDEQRYFEQLFALTDKMVVERVYNYAAITNAKPLRNISYYDDAIASLENLDVPESALKAHTLILKAAKEEREYFEKLIAGEKWNASAPLVQSAHKGLLEAWQVLLAAYPNESQHNRTTFEKHLCALDFI